MPRAVPRAKARHWPEAAAVALTALVFDPRATASAPKRIVFAVMAALWLASAIAPLLRGNRTALPVPLCWWLALCGWSCASLAWAQQPDPLRAVLPLATAAVAMVASSWSDDKLRGVAERAALLICGGCGLTAVVQLARGAAVVGLAGNSNWLGLAMAAALPLAAGSLLRLRGLARISAAGAVLLGMAALVLSHSRTAAAAVGLVALLQMRGALRGLALRGLALAGAAGLAAVMWTGAVTSLGGRAWIWRACLNAARRDWWTGSGLGDFGAVFLDGQAEALADLPLEQASGQFVLATSAHNDWLQWLCETGVIGALLAAVALATTAWQLRRSWRAGSACVLAVLVASLGDCTMLRPEVMVLLGLLLATGPRARPRAEDRFAPAVLLVAISLALPNAALDWKAQRHLSRARAAPPAERIAWLRRAAQLAPRNGWVTLELGLAYMTASQPSLARSWLLRSRRQLATIGVDVALGNASMQQGDPAKAAAWYRSALRRHPARVAALVNLGEALRCLGDLDGAARQVQGAAALLPNHPKVRALRDRIRKQRGVAINNTTDTCPLRDSRQL